MQAAYQISKGDLVVNDNFNSAYSNGDVLANVNNSAIDDLIASLPSTTATNDQSKEKSSNFNLW